MFFILLQVSVLYNQLGLESSIIVGVELINGHNTWEKSSLYKIIKDAIVINKKKLIFIIGSAQLYQVDIQLLSMDRSSAHWCVVLSIETEQSPSPPSPLKFELNL